MPADVHAKETVAAKPVVVDDQPADPAPTPRGTVRLVPIGGFTHGQFSTLAAEIVAYDADSRRLFVVNGEHRTIDILDVSDPTAPRKAAEFAIAPHGSKANSVAAKRGVIAVAVSNVTKQDPGKVVFLNADGEFLQAVDVGPEPDMLTFTPDGKMILTCNEGEPTSDYKRDPEGSVSVIDLSGGVASLSQSDVTMIDFRGFNDRRKELDPSIRIFGHKASVAQDLEPEYVAVSPDGKTAWVVLQENNALGVIDLASKQVTALLGLGFKDHSRAGNGLDASNKDKAIRIQPWPVKGMYQPDAIAAYDVNGKTYLVTANEGDSRKYSPFSEQVRVQDLKLDPRAFPHAAELQKGSNLGRLEVTNQLGDRDGDGKFEELYAFGGRSFSIWTADGKQVYDSGDEFERILAADHPAHFNANHDSSEFDDRSNDKGPEPEGLTLGRLNGSTYAFIGLERDGGILIYDITEPERPIFENYVSTRNFDGQHALGTTGDCAPEGLLFVPAEHSPNGEPLLAVAYEMSGTTRIYRIEVAGPAEK